jgi:hypothetical protein
MIASEARAACSQTDACSNVRGRRWTGAGRRAQEQSQPSRQASRSGCRHRGVIRPFIHTDARSQCWHVTNNLDAVPAHAVERHGTDWFAYSVPRSIRSARRSGLAMYRVCLFSRLRLLS